MNKLVKEENILQLIDTAVDDAMVSAGLRRILVTERDAINRGEALMPIIKRLAHKVTTYKDQHHINIESIDDLLVALETYIS